MSKFNGKQADAFKTVSHEGGVVYEKSLEDEWTNTLFSSLMGDGFYESAEEQQGRYIDLTRKMVDKYGCDFVAKAAHFSRNELGLRSISELTAAILNGYQFEGKRDFYKHYFRRPDGVAEVLGAVSAIGGRKSHALVRGAADYLSTLKDYQLDKYKMLGKEWNIYDLINVTHAKSDAIDRLKHDELVRADTWEQRISASKSESEKADNWRELVGGNRLGYLALLRNLRNICSCDFATDEWLDEYLVPQLVNEDKIKKSLVWPYQIYSAYKALGNSCPLSLNIALNHAFEKSISNMPTFDGRTLLVLDVSGSMNTAISDKSDMKIKEVCAVYCAAILKANPKATFIKFGDEYKICDNYNAHNIAPFSLISMMQENDDCGYGTDIVPVFNHLESSYDRIFLFSDMQVMGDDNRFDFWYGSKRETADEAMRHYFSKFGKCPIYSYDLGNYHSQLSKPKDDTIKYITALNDNTIKFISLMEDGGSIIEHISNYKPF